MKESLSRIVLWAKEHPWIAGGILVVVIIFAWLSVKNGWFGGGGGGSSGSGTTPTDGGGTSAVPDLGLSGIGNSMNPIPVSLPSNSGFVPSMPAENFPSLPSLPAENFPSLPSLPALSSDFAAGQALSSPSLLNFSAPASIVSTENAYSSGPGGKTSRKNKKLPANATPAMSVGKGRHFTGTVNGVYYIDGYPASGATPGRAQSVVTPAGNTATVYTGASGVQVTSRALDRM